MRGSRAAAPPVHGPTPVFASALDLRTSQIRTSERVMRQHPDIANQQPVVDRVREAR
jgi:hypothetical protein